MRHWSLALHALLAVYWWHPHVGGWHRCRKGCSDVSKEGSRGLSRVGVRR